jgi:Fe-S cluster assembly protein SufD
MPTNKNEEYRFTDISSVLQRTLVTPSPVPADAITTAVAARSLKNSTAASVVLVDGVIDATHTKINSLPKGVYVGGLTNAPADVVGFALGTQSRSRGGPFATLNGALSTEVVVVHVPEGVTVTEPIHILSLASSSSAATSLAASAPRVLVVLEEGATAEVIEEFSSINDSQGNYMVTAVTEIELDDRAALKHSYIDLEADGAAHFKTTLVNQGKESQYTLTEAQIGGSLTRHDLGVDQLGSETQTVMKSFLLAGQGQLHDLHSKLKLDHPDGTAEQIHKCIAVDPTSRGVFDGNVRVNKLAQRTDAQQLSRNLLMAPKATVNVKPNLQIIADDVKCTHGCSVSDLEEEELFYLRSRGISADAARQVLVYSFGREVVQHLKDDAAISRVEMATKQKLVSIGEPIV